MTFFLFFPENRICYFMQIVSNVFIGDNLHEMSKLFRKNKKNISICRMLKILPRVLSIKFRTSLNCLTLRVTDNSCFLGLGLLWHTPISRNKAKPLILGPSTMKEMYFQTNQKFLTFKVSQ